MKQTPIRWNFSVVVLCAVVLNQSIFGWDVPITSKPTRKIEAALLGDWYSGNAPEKVLQRIHKRFLAAKPGHQREVDVPSESWIAPALNGHTADEAETPALAKE